MGGSAPGFVLHLGLDVLQRIAGFDIKDHRALETGGNKDLHGIRPADADAQQDEKMHGPAGGLGIRLGFPGMVVMKPSLGTPEHARRRC